MSSSLQPESQTPKASHIQSYPEGRIGNKVLGTSQGESMIKVMWPISLKLSKSLAMGSL